MRAPLTCSRGYTVELQCSVPEFDLHPGDAIQVSSACTVRRDGAYLVELGRGARASHDVLRLKRMAASPTGLAVMVRGEWTAVTRDVRLAVLGQVRTVTSGKQQ